MEQKIKEKEKATNQQYVYWEKEEKEEPTNFLHLLGALEQKKIKSQDLIDAVNKISGKKYENYDKAARSITRNNKDKVLFALFDIRGWRATPFNPKSDWEKKQQELNGSKGFLLTIKGKGRGNPTRFSVLVKFKNDQWVDMDSALSQPQMINKAYVEDLFKNKFGKAIKAIWILSGGPKFGKTGLPRLENQKTSAQHVEIAQ